MKKLLEAYTRLIREYGKKRVADLFNQCLEEVDTQPIELTLEKLRLAGLPYQAVLSKDGQVTARRATRDWLRAAFGQAMRQA